MTRKPLSDPQWTSAAPVCIACNYSLAGLQSEGCCPECGTPYFARRLELQGIPTAASGGRTWRRLVWASLIVVAVVMSQFWPFLLILGGPFARWATFFVLLVMIAGIVFMIATSRRERRGAERFVFSPAGIGHMPLRLLDDSAAPDSLLTPWGAANAVELKRVSQFWRRLRIGVVSRPGGSMAPIFVAGVRCPDAAAEEVTRYLLALIHKTPLPVPTEKTTLGVAPPTTPPTLPLGQSPPTAPPTTR